MTDEGYSRLRELIIEQAIKDYVNCKKNKDKEEQLERFFRSDWYNLLCDIDGEFMISILKEKKQSLKENGRLKRRK